MSFLESLKKSFLKQDSIKQSYTQKKRISDILSIFSSAAFFVTLLYAIIDFYTADNPKIIIWDLAIAILILLIYYLNNRGKTEIAAKLFLIVLNITLFIYADLFPPESGLFFLFFPIMGATVIFITQEPKVVKILFISLPIVCLFILVVFDYSIFGNDIFGRKISTHYNVNFAISAITFAFSIYYMTVIYDKSLLDLQLGNDRFRLLANDYEKTNKRLVKANRELDQFLYSTSHDLRAPLMSLLGLIQLMEHEQNKDVLISYYSMMKDRIKNMDSFIKDITNYSRNARTGVTSESVNVEQLISKTIDEFKLYENARNIEFKMLSSMNGEIKTDRLRLQIILNNLITNAIKYHDLESGDPKIEVESLLKDKELHISVKDNGPGMDENVQKRMFEMFYRGSEASNGSGLGLYIVKEILENLRGKIEVNSKVGVGSEFKIQLPL